MLIAMLLILSCTDNSLPVANTDDAQNVQLRLVITIPASTIYTRTRGALSQTDHESVINEIQVLVFEDGKYQYRVPGISISGDGSHTAFTARLKSTPSTVRLLILANSTDAVLANEPSAGDAIDAVKEKISAKIDYPASGFPMYGEYELPQGLAVTGINTITGIKMLRAIARVDVEATEVSNFKLTGVKAYRANSYLQVIPNETGILKVTQPSVPAISIGNMNSNIFVVSDADMNDFSARLYLPESASPATDEWISRATCIVVEGYYAGSDKLSYYRMDFDPDNQNNAFGQVLRNHKYIFHIKKVSASGWEQPDEAANNRSSHIDVEVQAWDDYTLDMYFDGEHHFGISTREIVLKNKPNSSALIDVSTDLTDYTMQWADAQGTPEGTASQSLVNEYFKVEKGQGGSQLIITALKDNSANNIRRSQNFMITANRWRILVNIQQRYDVAAQRMINMLTFNAGLGNLGVNILTPIYAAESRSDGLRGMLDNVNNFGPSGTVICGGYNLLRANVNANNLTDLLFSTADVIFVHYIPSAYFGSQDALRVHNWLKAKNNRVLLVSFDASDVSLNILNEVLYGQNGIEFLITNNGAFPLASQVADNLYFTQTGPFTSNSNSAIPSDFSFRNYDAYHGEILLNTEASRGITPILMGPKGGIVLGIDYARRIVYLGDVDLGNSTKGIGGTDDNRINNTTGNINSGGAKLMANLFAWITETVLAGD